MDKPKMVFAGVDAGAKIFVELDGESGAAAAAATKQSKTAKILIAFRVAELCPRRIVIQKEPYRLSFVWRCGRRRA
jgi:hypothetical protein